MKGSPLFGALGKSDPDEPACADFPWDRDGFIPDRWGPVLKALGMLPFMLALLAVMNYVVFVADGGAPLFAKLIVGLFDLILLFSLYRLALMLLRAIKYGRTRLRFAHFPFRRGGEVLPVRIELPSPARRARGGRLTLRQIEEFWEVTGRSRHRNKRIVHDCAWSGERVFEEGGLPVNSSVLAAGFLIPAEAMPTRIDAERPLFWELELELATPGVDYCQRYLVPVY